MISTWQSTVLWIWTLFPFCKFSHSQPGPPSPFSPHMRFWTGASSIVPVLTTRHHISCMRIHSSHIYWRTRQTWSKFLGLGRHTYGILEDTGHGLHRSKYMFGELLSSLQQPLNWNMVHETHTRQCLFRTSYTSGAVRFSSFPLSFLFWTITSFPTSRDIRPCFSFGFPLPWEPDCSSFVHQRDSGTSIEINA